MERTTYFLFILHSAFISLWGVSIPYLHNQLELSNIHFGLLIAILPLASIFGAWLSNYLVHPRTVFLAAGIYVGSITCLISGLNLFPTVLLLIISGLCSSHVIIEANKMAVSLENKNRNILGKCHSMYSSSMVLSLLFGNILMIFFYKEKIYFIGIAGFFILALFIFCFNTGNFQPFDNKVKNYSITELKYKSAIVLPLMAIGFLAMMVENLYFNWIGIYSASQEYFFFQFSGIALLVFSIAMFLGRLLLDSLRKIYTNKKVLIFGIFLSFIGQTLTIIIDDNWGFLFGVFVSGFGISFLVPILYKVISNEPYGISLLTGIGMVSFLVTPILVGGISEVCSLKITFFIIMISFFVGSMILLNKVRL